MEEEDKKNRDGKRGTRTRRDVRAGVLLTAMGEEKVKKSVTKKEKRMSQLLSRTSEA